MAKTDHGLTVGWVDQALGSPVEKQHKRLASLWGSKTGHSLPTGWVDRPYVSLKRGRLRL